MVVLSILKRQSKKIAPFLLRNGLKARHRLSVLQKGADNLWLDRLCLLPLTQEIVSIGVQYDFTRAAYDEQRHDAPPSQLDVLSERVWERLFGKDDDDDAGGRRVDPSEARLRSLESYVLPALVPHDDGTWRSRRTWRHNDRFVAWLRRELLLARYARSVTRALTRNPGLRAFPAALPTQHELARAFGTTKWNRHRNDAAQQRRLTKIATEILGGGVVPVAPGSGRVEPDVAEGTRIRTAYSSDDDPGVNIGDDPIPLLSLEDLLELTGGHVADLGPFNIYCEEKGIYEFWTQNYIDALARYLLQRSNNNSKNNNGDTIVLEVGAGDGMLTHHLRKACDRLLATNNKKSNNKPPTFVATDDGSWRINNTGDVERLNVVQALNEHAAAPRRHVVVLCSWMVKGVDWTADFRNDGNGVDEYVLIGETDDGSCGHNWYTWGNRSFLEQQDGDDAAPILPYERDGYERTDLPDLSRLQFSRYDSRVSRSSSTVSFRRRKIQDET